jgi:multicomponent Na+:H+ antiporter subunit F
MSAFLSGIIVFLLLNILVGTLRLVIGPSPADRMLAVQLFGTTGMGVLLVMSIAFEQPLLINIALVFALLAVMTLTAFVRRASTPDPEGR